jgi:RNA 2',3'-cyclic 3'-phosphodiesterase
VRLFLAIELTHAARRAIAAEQTRVKQAAQKSGSDLRWVKAEQLHLTLVFLGEVAEEGVEALVDAVGRPFEIPAFRIVFGGIGMFPPHGAPRVLWLGLPRGADEVIAVQRQLVDRVAALGLAIEDRPFHPHVTLGRWRSSRPADRRRFADTMRTTDVAAVDVAVVSLISSRLSPAGPTYTALCHAPLAEPGLQSER